MFNDKKARAKKLHDIINNNKIDFFTLNQVQAVVGSYLAALVTFPAIQDQDNARVKDIIAGAIAIAILSSANLTADIFARVKDKKKLEHLLRCLRADVIDVSIIMNFITQLAELFASLPSNERNAVENGIISISDWLEGIGYYKAAILVGAIAIKLGAGILLERSQKPWINYLNHAGTVIIDGLTLYNFSSLGLIIVGAFDATAVTPWAIRYVPMIAASTVGLELFPDLPQLKNKWIFETFARITRGHQSFALLLKLTGVIFMAVNNIISFIALKLKDLEYPNAIAYAILDNVALLSLNLVSLVFNLKSAKNEVDNNFNLPDKLALEFIYEWKKSLFWREALLGTTPWTIIFPIISAAVATVSREKDWRIAKSINSYLVDAALVAALGLTTFGAAVTIPVSAGIIALEGGIDLFQLRGRSFWTNALINFIRTGLTSYVLGSSFPVPYLPYALTPTLLALNAVEIFSQKPKTGEGQPLLENQPERLIPETNIQRSKSSPAHTALTIFMVLFLSAREAFSEENSNGSWAAQLLLLATLIPLAIRLAAALMPKNYNNIYGFFGIPKISLPCSDSKDEKVPKLNW